MNPVRLANGGDTTQHLERIAKAGEPGALVRLELPQHPRVDPEMESKLLLSAWQQLQRLFLGEGVGFCTFYQSETVVTGDRDKLTSKALSLFEQLTFAQETRHFAWHIVLIELFEAEPIRTAMCDPNYDLDPKQSLLAWVAPYAGADWRESQRYPRTTILRQYIPKS